MKNCVQVLPGGGAWISTSENLTDWSRPKMLLSADFPDAKLLVRRFLAREIIFNVRK